MNGGYMIDVFMRGMLDKAFISRWRPSVIRNVAFKSGSSKQGKTRRASVGSNWVDAMYLMLIETYLSFITYIKKD